MKVLFFLTISLTILLADCCWAKTWYVKPDSTGEVIDLQTAIDVAADGDTVMASAGIFIGEGNCDLDFSGKAIVMTTEYGPDSTTIACDGVPVFSFVSGEDSMSVLNGYCIDQFASGPCIQCISSSPTIKNNEINARIGTGLYLSRSNAIIINNIMSTIGGEFSTCRIYCEHDSSLIQSNFVAGGDDCRLIYCYESSNRIVSNRFDWGQGVTILKGSVVFRDNRILETYYGSGISCDSATVDISNNTIYSMGSGVVISSGTYEISKNTIMGGHGNYVQGGGIYCIDVDSSTVINDNIIHYSGIDWGDGGGIYCDHASPVICNNIIAHNLAERGGAIYCTASSPSIINNTLEGNQSLYSGSGIYLTNDSDPAIERCIIANGSGHYSQFSIYGIYAEDAASQPIISCCDVYNNETGNYGGYLSDQNGINGNFGADPLFCDPEEGIYTIHIESPCAPGNHPDGVDCGLIGARRVECGFFEATIDIDPNTLNLKSHGRWITCYIELPEEYDVTNVDIESIRLDDYIPAAVNVSVTGDYDSDAIPDLMVKFCRSKIIDLFSSLVTVQEVAIVTVAGKVGSEHFRGTDCIRIKGQPHTFLEPEAAVSQAGAPSLGIHPNPFNAAATISYYLPATCEVTVEIYDSSGRLISRLLDRVNKPKGMHEVEWKGIDGHGNQVASGVYFYRLITGMETISKKMVLLR